MNTKKRIVKKEKKKTYKKVFDHKRDFDHKSDFDHKNDCAHKKVFDHKKVRSFNHKKYDKKAGCKICRKIVRYAVLPYKILRKISLQRIGRLFQYLHEEGVGGTIKRFRECIYGTDIYQREYALSSIKNIRSITECRHLVFPHTERPLVSILIPAYNEFNFTYNCLQSIYALKDQTSYEVILADDGSNDLTKEIRRAVKNIKIVRMNKNAGFIKNCNHAAGYAAGKYILFLNNDTQVQDGWLDSLAQMMESDKTIGLAGSKLIYPDMRLQQAGGILWRDGTAYEYGNRKDPAAPEYNYVREVDYVCGASMMIPRKLWKEIGGFDESFAPAYCEDSDLALQVRKHGYRVVYQPKSVAVHYEGISHGTDVSKGVKRHQMINQRRLYQKWKSELSAHNEPDTGIFQARERSQQKKTVLFLDHYVPTFDCDAGSRTVYAFLKMFLAKGWCVKFVGANFYQGEPYTSQLQQMGIEVLYGVFYSKNFFSWLTENQNYIDAALLNRPHITIDYIDYFCTKTNIRTFYYGHDLHFLRNQREYALTKDESTKAESDEWYRKEMYILKRAAVSYYPSQIEVQEIKKIDPSIPVKAVTPYIYDDVSKDAVKDFDRCRGILFVGGFNHGPNQDGVLWFVKKVYPKIWAVQKIPFYIAGSHMPKVIRELDGTYGVEVKGHVSDKELDRLYKTCRLAVVPLRYGAGIKGKVIEAAYHAVPVVTTTVGAEGIEGLGAAAAVADDETAFAKEVLRLYGDCRQLQIMAQASRDLIRKHYSMDAAWKVFEEDFQ